MFKKRIVVVFIFCFLLILFFLIALYYNQIGNREEIVGEKNNYLDLSSFSEICFKSFCFEIEVAQTSEEKKQGLMFREYLPENKGMLFEFNQEGIHSIWMKNTLILLDIIWLDKNLEVVFMKENALPCKSDPCPVYSNLIPAQYVLEVNAGKVKELELEIGDKLQ
ncbi:MAG: DUF192 domain-containing protein [Candidatus Nealsonbacteria bacterium]|jgi:uncharacterized membrane protein (UPF0127 family)|nr:DUF192 domain-containing protein [Candidatus Nealsonbacteria bacterium]